MGAEHLVPGVVERCDDESAQKRERIRAELPRRDGAGDARFGGVSAVVFLTLFGVVAAWHYAINVRSKDVNIKRAANEEPIVVTVRMQGMILLLLSGILIFGFTSFSGTFVACVSVGAGRVASHLVMKAPPLTDTNSSSDGGDSGSTPSLLAEFQEYTGSTLSTFNRGAGFEKSYRRKCTNTEVKRSTQRDRGREYD